jgi:hypothetical protein
MRIAHCGTSPAQIPFLDVFRINPVPWSFPMKLRLDLDAMEVTTFEVTPAVSALKQERVTVNSQTCGVVCNWTD